MRIAPLIAFRASCVLMTLVVASCSKEAPLFECGECRCDIATWERVSSESPADNLTAAAFVRTPEGSLTVGAFALTGGIVPMSLWRWDGTSWTDQTTGDPTMGTSAPNRTAIAAAYHAEAGHVVVVGGAGDGAGQDTSTWTLASGSWELEPSAAPEGRINAQAAYHAVDRQVIVVGGQDTVFAVPATTSWAWDGSVWTTVSSQDHPSPRISHAVTYDEARESIVLFGGTGMAGGLGDTWIYDDGQWTEVMPAQSPAPRAGHSLAYDPVQELTVLVGGVTAEAGAEEIWTWDGTQWKELHVPNPPSGFAGRVVYDDVNEAFVTVRTDIIGTNVLVQDTWLLRLDQAEAAMGMCCGDGVCQVPELIDKSCPADCDS